MSLKYALLGVLEVGPMTGYELAQLMESSARWVWSAPQSQIYPLLKKLESDGLIEGSESIKGTRLARTSYRLTTRGLDDLRSWLGAVHPPQPVRDGFLLQALFCDLVDADDACGVFEHHVEELETAIASWRAHRDLLLRRRTPLMEHRTERHRTAPSTRTVLLKAAVFDGMIRTHEARLSWAQDTLAMLRAGTELFDGVDT